MCKNANSRGVCNKVQNKDHSHEIGSAKIKAGSMFEDLISFMPLIRMPVAKVMRPPQALKSQSILGLTSGIIKEARRNRSIQIAN